MEIEKNDNRIKYLDAGDSCLHLILGDEISVEMHQRVKSLYEKLNDKKIPGIREVVPAYRSVSIYYDPLQISDKKLRQWAEETRKSAGGPSHREQYRRIHIPVLFGGEEGPDLARVAQFHGMTEEVIDRFCRQDFLNYFLGFMPGKPYLGGLPSELETPRLEVPRLKVPSGTVVLFGKQAGMFGVEQPSGANCLGRSPVRIYDLRKENPVLLKMGDYLRFYPIERTEYEKLMQDVENMTYQEEIEIAGGPTDE